MGPMGSSTPALRIMPVRQDQVEIAEATACWEVVGSVLRDIEDGTLRSLWAGPTCLHGLAPDERNVAIAAASGRHLPTGRLQLHMHFVLLKVI